MLIERLMQLQEPRISSHIFKAVVRENRRGKLTQAEAGALLKLNAAELTEAVALIARVASGQLTADEIEDVLMLAWERLPGYDTVAAIKTRLGV